MRKHWLCLLFTIPATLFIPNVAAAEVVSTKATDLAGTQTSNQQTVAQNNFSVAQNFEADDFEKEINYGYISGSLGASFPNDVTLGNQGSVGLNTAFQGNIAVGYQWEQSRAELELGHGSYGVNSVKGLSAPASGSINATTLMANGYWDIPTNSMWSPYLGAGIGVGFVEAKYNAFSDKGTALALQGKAGIQYEFSRKRHAFLELKYQNIGGFSSGSGINKVDVGSTNSFGISIGYRQGF